DDFTANKITDGLNNSYISYGYSFALWYDGNTVAIGAPSKSYSDRDGYVIIYRYFNLQWNQIVVLTKMKFILILDINYHYHMMVILLQL
ncbi:MAG: hypothetical protein ACKPKO_29545, partial [Candidatus Fonsibacter sp.]